MEGLLLPSLLLLGALESVSTRTTGELCRAWAYGVGPLVGAFQCPEGLQATDAQFCCGTCSAPYCCSSGEERLDQAQCAPQEAQAGTVLPDPTPTSLIGKADLWLVAGFWFVAIVLVLLSCHSICYYTGIMDWLKSRRWWRTHQEEAEPTELDDLHPLPRPRVQAMLITHAMVRRQARLQAMCSDPPPSYESCVALDPPPSYSSLDLRDSGSMLVHHSSEEAPEVASVLLGTLPSRRDPCHSLKFLCSTETEV